MIYKAVDIAKADVVVLQKKVEVVNDFLISKDLILSYITNNRVNLNALLIHLNFLLIFSYISS